MQKLNQKGIGVIAVIISIVALGAAVFAGWRVWGSRQVEVGKSAEVATEAPSEPLEQEKKEKETYVPPEDWKKYEEQDTGISFYYPKEWDNDTENYYYASYWDKGELFLIESYEIGSPISSKFGTPDSVVFDVSSNKWRRYLNFGAEHEKPLEAKDEYGLKVADIGISDYPAAYIKAAHASVVTHDIFFIFDNKAYRLRLPEINSFNDVNWEESAQEQAEAIADIIASLEFKPD